MTSEICGRCGAEHTMVWRAPDDLWEKYHQDYNILCLNCFDELAGDLMLYWECEISEYPTTYPDNALREARLKIERQAEQITRLEKSRADMRKSTVSHQERNE